MSVYTQSGSVVISAGGVCTNTAITFDYYIGTSGSDTNAGTLGSPWAITTLNPAQSTNPTAAAANQTAMAGKRTGVLAGTYNVEGYSVISASSVLLELLSGTAGNPTVLQSVTPQGAILTGNNSGTLTSHCILGSGLNGVNGRASIQYVTIDGFEINGSSFGLIGFDSTAGAGTQAGIIIRNCLLHNLVNPSGANNCGGINLGTTLTGALIHNCRIYDCYENGIARTTHGNAAAIYDWALQTTIEYCTISDCNSGTYQKNQSTGPPQGEVCRFCYFWFGSQGMNTFVDGFDNSSETSPPYDSNYWYGNVFEFGNGNVGHYDSNPGNGYQATTYFYNNTIYSPGAMDGWTDHITNPDAISASCKVNYYNNVYARPSGDLNSTGWPDVAFHPSALGTINYNLWPTDASIGTNTTDSSTGMTFYTFTQWQAHAGSPDANSLAAAPTFSGGTPSAGAGTSQYQLTSGSNGHNAGHIGGVSGGAACDMGAWGVIDPNTGSLVAQIGSSF